MNNLFSYSVAANLVNLKELTIESCYEMSYVVTEDDAAETSETKLQQIIFHKLKRLILYDLPKLQNFCEGRCDHQSPSLKRLDITNVGFYSARECVSLFCNTQVLCIEGCVNMNNLFSYSVAAHLVNLKTLYITTCSEMVYVIAEDDAAETSLAKPQQIIFHKLEDLTLYDLPKLQNFCEGRWDFQLPSLKELDIKNVGGFYSARESVHLFGNAQSTFGSLHPLFCNIEVLCVEGCVNINNLFSYSVAVNLVNLIKLTIESCDEMAYVIAGDLAETSETQQIIFHKLEDLKLHHLPKLQNFCEGRWDIQLPSLKELDIEKVGFYSTRECVPLFCNTQITFNKLTHLCIQGYLGDRDHIKHLFTYSVAANLVNLEVLDISDYKEMVYVIADDVDDFAKTSGHNPQTIFHKLKGLDLCDLPKLQNFCEGRWDLQLPSLERRYMWNVGFYSARECVLFCNAQSTFDKLTYLSIQGNLGDRDHIKHLFSYSVAGNLVNLETLEICDYKEMVYVIADMGDDITKTSGNNPQTIEGFNEKLYGIAYHDDAETSETKPQQIIFHKLEKLTLHHLPKLQNFCEGRCDLQLPSLERINIKNVGLYSACECVQMFCNTQITFDKLMELDIKGYLGDDDHIKHLFSYSVVGNLVNLEKLSISNFSEMVYVIADEDDIAKTSGNNPQTIFRKLRWVELSDLPKLQSVCDWGWDVQFPSLKILGIIDCPRMEGVTPESIRKQNMEGVRSRRQRVEVD